MNPGLLAGLGSFLGGGINYFANRETNEANRWAVEQANAANLQIARERNQMEIDLWHEQTAYNAPIAQMSRLQAAGLNPNLVYGQIAESKMAAPPNLVSPEMQAPHAEPFRTSGDNPLAVYAQVKNLQAMNELRNVEISKAKSEAISAAARARYDVFESNELTRSGTLKSDTSMFKTLSRGSDLLYRSGQYWGNRLLDLNNAIADKLYRSGRWVLEKASIPEGNADERR